MCRYIYNHIDIHSQWKIFSHAQNIVIHCYLTDIPSHLSLQPICPSYKCKTSLKTKSVLDIFAIWCQALYMFFFCLQSSWPQKPRNWTKLLSVLGNLNYVSCTSCLHVVSQLPVSYVFSVRGTIYTRCHCPGQYILVNNVPGHWPLHGFPEAYLCSLLSFGSAFWNNYVCNYKIRKCRHAVTTLFKECVDFGQKPR